MEGEWGKGRGKQKGKGKEKKQVERGKMKGKEKEKGKEEVKREGKGESGRERGKILPSWIIPAPFLIPKQIYLFNLKILIFSAPYNSKILIKSF